MNIHAVKILITVFTFSSLVSYSQNISTEFISIREDSKLSIDKKDIKFQLLLNKHKNQNKLNLLINDAFEISRLYSVQQEPKWLKKSVELVKMNLKIMDSLSQKDDSFYRRNLYALGYYENYSANQKGALENFKKLLTYKEKDLYVLRLSLIHI